MASTERGPATIKLVGAADNTNVQTAGLITSGETLLPSSAFNNRSTAGQGIRYVSNANSLPGADVRNDRTAPLAIAFLQNANNIESQSNADISSGDSFQPSSLQTNRAYGESIRYPATNTLTGVDAKISRSDIAIFDQRSAYASAATTSGITYFAMRALDANSVGVVYRTWTVITNPDTTAAYYTGPFSGGSMNFTDITIIAKWSV